MFWVRDAAVYRTDAGTAGPFCVFGAFGAFFGDDVVELFRETWVFCFVAEGSTVREVPAGASFVDRVVRAFGLASTAVNALFCYFDSHLWGFFDTNVTLFG